MTLKGRRFLSMVRRSSKQAHETTERSIVAPSRRAVARESLAVLLFAAAMFLFICLVSYDYRDPSFNVATTRPYVANLGGLIGSHVADGLVQAFGVTSMVVPVILLILSLKLVLPGRGPLKWSETGSMIVLIAVSSVMAERFLVPPALKFAGSHAGGAIGSSLHDFLLRFLGSGGELLFSFTIMCLCILRMSRVSVRGAAKLFAWVGALSFTGLAAGWKKLKTAHGRGKDRGTQDYDDYLGPYKNVDEEHPDFNEIGLPKDQPFDDEEIVRAAKFSPPWERLHDKPARDPEMDFPSPTGNADRPEPVRGSKAVPARSLSQNKGEITVKELEKSIRGISERQSRRRRWPAQTGPSEY